MNAAALEWIGALLGLLGALSWPRTRPSLATGGTQCPESTAMTSQPGCYPGLTNATR